MFSSRFSLSGVPHVLGSSGLLALGAGVASNAFVVRWQGGCAARGMGPRGTKGRGLKRSSTGAKLYLGSAVAKRLVYDGEWTTITHIVECQERLQNETPPVTAFFVHFPGGSA